MAMDNGGKDYIQTLIYLFVGLGLFIAGVLGAYFGAVGLYFGQGVVEGDVWQDYKYACANQSQSASECTSFDTNTTTAAYQDYQAFTNELNPTVLRYITATSVVFSLLGLVFLFVALRSANIFGNKKTKNMREDF